MASYFHTLLEPATEEAIKRHLQTCLSASTTLTAESMRDSFICTQLSHKYIFVDNIEDQLKAIPCFVYLEDEKAWKMDMPLIKSHIVEELKNSKEVDLTSLVDTFNDAFDRDGRRFKAGIFKRYLEEMVEEGTVEIDHQYKITWYKLVKPKSEVASSSCHKL